MGQDRACGKLGPLRLSFGLPPPRSGKDFRGGCFIMASAALRFVLATSLPAFLSAPTAAMAKDQRLPTSKEVGQGLLSEEIDRCRSGHESRPIAQSHCGMGWHAQASVTFDQILCVNHGADSEKNPIARCVFKGERRAYPNLPGQNLMEVRRARQPKAKPQSELPSQLYGDGEGAIDLVYINGSWLSIPEPKISFE